MFKDISYVSNIEDGASVRKTRNRDGWLGLLGSLLGGGVDLVKAGCAEANNGTPVRVI